MAGISRYFFSKCSDAIHNIDVCCIYHQYFSSLCSYCRTADDVQTLIQHAKLFEGDLQPLTQVLSFAPRTEAQGKYRFLELDPTLLSNLQQGQRYLFGMAE
jgi:hypothetical protein